MKNKGNIGNRGREKNDHLDTSALLNKMTYRGKFKGKRESVSDSITRFG